MTPQTDQDETTESAQTRWPYTNDVAAILLVLSFVAAVGAAAYAIATGRIDASIDFGLLIWGYLALVLLAGTWLFGSDAFDALARLRGGGG